MSWLLFLLHLWYIHTLTLALDGVCVLTCTLCSERIDRYNGIVCVLYPEVWIQCVYQGQISSRLVFNCCGSYECDVVFGSHSSPFASFTHAFALIRLEAVFRWRNVWNEEGFSGSLWAQFLFMYFSAVLTVWTVFHPSPVHEEMANFYEWISTTGWKKIIIVILFLF